MNFPLSNLENSSGRALEGVPPHAVVRIRGGLGRLAAVVAAGVLLSTAVYAQLNSSAFRVLGQPDLRQNGLNGVQGSELFAPSGVALDLRGGELHIYVVDTGNNRILGWRNANGSQAGATADLVLGQPNLRTSVPLGIGNTGLNGPTGVAVNPANGDLFVADTGNNRVLRFPSPFQNPGRVEPNAVYGQPNFAQRNANTGGISEETMREPTSVAFDRQNSLWVADRGNNRVLRYPLSALDVDEPGADIVIGQANFTQSAANAGQNRVNGSSFNSPYGLTFDSQGALYVSDFTNARILIFNAPQKTGQEANRVLGQPSFETSGAPANPTNATLRGPAGIRVVGANLYVSVPLDHRVLIYKNIVAAPAGATADEVRGQVTFTTAIRNINTQPRAGEKGLAGPADVTADSDGNVFVADQLNHRVIAYPAGSVSATRVWGQKNLTQNAANGLESSSISGAYEIAIDYTSDPFPIYVSDSNNNRILIWRNSTNFSNGAPADLVIGQADLTTGVANADTGVGQTPTATSLASQRGITLDANGNLWVADTGNNRVLRYAKPIQQSGRITADIVIGQNDFTSSVSASVTSSSLRLPSDVAFGPQGTLFVSDTGNNRVLQFSPNPGTGAAAVRVFGQSDFFTGSTPGQITAESLALPEGIHIDDFGFLYVADTGANRVLIFPNASDGASSGASASAVIGQQLFATAGASAGNAGLNGPRTVTTDKDGKIYISDSGNHRIVIFPEVVSLPIFGGQASGFLGQPNINTNRANFNSSDGTATPQGLFAPVGLFVDRNSTLYVGDTGNNRVLHFLKPGIVVNGAHFLPQVPVSPGALVSLFGLGFSEQSEQASAVPLPQQLAARTVELSNGTKAPLLYMSPQQINLQLPTDTPAGTIGIAVRRADTSELLAGGAMSVLDASPGFFTENQNGLGQTLALNENGTRNGPSNPAARGSVVQIFGTGQGAVDPPVPSGQAAGSGPLSSTLAKPTSDGATCLTVQPSVCVAIGSTFGQVTFSGLAPGFVGLWQINVKIPDSVLPSATVPVRPVLNGRPGNTTTLAIQ